MVVDSGTVGGAGRAVELGVALQTFAATVEMDKKSKSVKWVERAR